MSRPMNKKLKGFIIAIVAVALLGICFTCVSFYARHEMTKERFHLPEIDELPNATELPEGNDEIFAYAMKAYGEATAADDAEVSSHTDIAIDGDYSEASLSKADAEIIEFIKGGAVGQIAALYPNYSGVRMNELEKVPPFEADAGSLVEATATRGRQEESGEIKDDGYYFITLRFAPESLDVSGIENEEVYKSIVDTLSQALTVDKADLEVEAYEYSLKVDRLNDKLAELNMTKVYKIDSVATFIGDYASMGTQKLGWRYTETERTSLRWYGVRFNQQQIAVNKGDMKSLPIDVYVNPGAAQDEFDLSYTFSHDSVIEVDKDSVMLVKDVCDDPVTITATLKYDGHVYTDSLTVYLTEMEVATVAGQQQY